MSEESVFSMYEHDECFDSGYLKVSDIHELYYERYGNENGIPVLYLHGGPGSCTKPKNANYFDPEKYHVILFDQRGCGKSKPSPCLDENTTEYLVNDVEKMRQHFSLDKVVLFGGSWGSALGLLYGIQYPQNVMGMVLYGIFLADKEGVDVLHQAQSTAALFFPEEYQKYTGTFGEENPLQVCHDAMLNGSDEEKKQASVSLLMYEGALCGMELNNLADAEKRAVVELEMTEQEKAEAQAGLEKFAYVHSLTESYYDLNGFFIEDGYILKNADKLKGLPIHIVQGRYDMVCPPKFAWALHNQLSGSSFTMVPNAGHSGSEMAQELVEAVEGLL